MLIRSFLWVVTFVLGASFATSAFAQSRVEEMLRNPWVQQILGNRAPTVRADLIQSEAALCANAQFRAANVQRCVAVDQAARLATIPPELRLVLTTPASAAALRELCLTAPGVTASNNYLCTELAKGDSSLVEQFNRRAFEQIHGDQRP